MSEPPELSFAAASARGQELRELWLRAPQLFQRAEFAEWVSTAAPAEAEVRAVVDALLPRAAEAAPYLDSALELLGELGPVAPGANETTKALLRASALGHWRAESALVRILERRLEAAAVPCSPPTTAETARARSNLTGFLVLDRRVRVAGEATLVARPLSASELEDLAYLYVAVAEAGAEVGSVSEDSTTPGTSSTERQALGAKITATRMSGDLEGHLAAALAYLTALGYPGPIRVNDDRDERWGGPGYSFLMRELALDAELLGEYALAESLYRRAAWDGGMCGTSAPSFRDDQIAGVIRAVELGRGDCRGVVAERLFAISSDLREVHGPERLAAHGFDVTRLYRAALLTRNRSDEPALRAALVGAKGEGPARLDRLGAEDWMGRLRAIRGLADTAKGGAIGALLPLLTVGDANARSDAIAALGALARDRGSDPCDPSGGFAGYSTGTNSGERAIASLMTSCETRLAAAKVRSLVDAIGKLATDPEPTTREAVARALGNLGSTRARSVLRRLVNDTFDTGGQVCSGPSGGPMVCREDRIVAIAAEQALNEIAEAERARAELRARRPYHRGAAGGAASIGGSAH